MHGAKAKVIEPSDFRTRRAVILFVGSTFSSLGYSSAASPRQRMSALLSLLLIGIAVLRPALYFSLYFNDKGKPAVCDVRFVPNVQAAQRHAVSGATAARRAL